MIKDIPQIGFGTWLIKDKDVLSNAIDVAIKSGYTHIDTAQRYNNEFQIGEILQELNINRENIFITSKIAPPNYKYHAYESIHESLKRLKLKYIDLMLMHYGIQDNDVNIICYKEMMKARDEGLIKHIGVSNMSIDEIEAIYDATSEYPYINQIILTPTFNNLELAKYCRDRNIKITGYSIIKSYFDPHPFYPKSGMSDSQKSFINDLSNKYKKDVGQILNRWALHIGYSILPKSIKPERIASNIQLLDFELSNDEINKISSFNMIDKNEYKKLVLETLNKMISEDVFEKGQLYDKNF